MKTDKLIDLLAQDAGHTEKPTGVRLASAAIIGGAASMMALLATLGARPDLGGAFVAGWRLPLKIAFAAVLAAGAFAALKAVSRPERSPATAFLPLVAAPVILLAGIAAELVSVPASAWASGLQGEYAGKCLVAIPALSIVPLALVLWAMRSAAPRSPSMAGTVTGLAASGLAAAVYALRCPDDSPLFVAVWYLLAISIVTLTGRLIGSRILRW